MFPEFMKAYCLLIEEGDRFFERFSPLILRRKLLDYTGRIEAIAIQR